MTQDLKKFPHDFVTARRLRDKAKRLRLRAGYLHAENPDEGLLAKARKIEDQIREAGYAL